MEFAFSVSSQAGTGSFDPLVPVTPSVLVYGTPGDDYLPGTVDDDQVEGDAGNDTIFLGGEATTTCSATPTGNTTSPAAPRSSSATT